VTGTRYGGGLNQAKSESQVAAEEQSPEQGVARKGRAWLLFNILNVIIYIGFLNERNIVGGDGLSPNLWAATPSGLPSMIC
jgi:hypothetical protein